VGVRRIKIHRPNLKRVAEVGLRLESKMHKRVQSNIAMVIICLVILALSVNAFVRALRGVSEGREDEGGFHPAP
jgi:hypothetical protein